MPKNENDTFQFLVEKTSNNKERYITENQQRTSCIDPLPTCKKLCEKILSCGPINDHHRCSAQCHNGLCPPCNKQSILQCRCGQSSKYISCLQAIQYDSIKDPFCCERQCNKKKLCGKHRCNELCCDRDIHLCEIVCGRTLNCNIHKCEDLCHENSCRKCPIISYDELTCRCGKTIIQPPIECGTKPPICNHPYNRTHACDRPESQTLSINLDEPRPSPIVYTNFLRGYARRNLEIVEAIERKFSLLVKLSEYHGHPTGHHHGLKLHLSLKPMHVDEDRLIHALAPFYGLETRQVNYGPYENKIVIYASYGICKMPYITLSETIGRQ